MSVSIQSNSSNSARNSGGSSTGSPRPSSPPSSPRSPDPFGGLPHPAPANVMPCDDAGHCLSNFMPQCETAVLRNCPGLPNGRTPPSYHGNIIHPQPGSVITCANCRIHDTNAWGPFGVPTNWFIETFATEERNSGLRNQLCYSCIRDEMELYWLRQGTNPPQGPALSVHRVVDWPIMPNADQNLCICQRDAVDRWVFHCHACRDEALRITCMRPYRRAENILRCRTRPVITGKKRCALNGGTAQHWIGLQRKRNRVNAGFGRRCPCGNKSKPMEPGGSEWISICLACMGVRIELARMPAKYQRANMQPRRRSPRGHAATAGPVLSRTQGPKAAQRSPEFRVNIERGWVENDWFVGGTW